MPRHQAFPAILSFLAALSIYGICLRNDFVYDDLLLLHLDDRIGSVSQWRRCWTESYNFGVDNLYRPLVSMSFAIQWKLHGDRPWPFFAVNILLHAACAAAVAELARRLICSLSPSGERAGVRGETSARPGNILSSDRAALLAGLLFAVHPVHTEAVASVVGRAETMCALFALVALVLLLGRMTIVRAVMIWLCATASLLSKEHALLLPLLMLLLSALYGFDGDRRARLTTILLMLWTWAGYIIFREYILKFWWDRSLLDWVVQPIVRSEGVDRWLWPLALVGRYAVLLSFPHRLSIDYGVAVTQPSIRPDDVSLYIGAAALAVWIGLMTRALLRRQRAMLFVLVSFALSYAVIANFFTLIGTIMGERLIYLPSIFFILLLAFLLGYARGVGLIIAGILLALGSWRTISYAAQFDERLHFYAWSAKNQPRSIKIGMLLASELMQRGQLDRAAEVSSQTRQLAPEASEPWLQSGVIEMERQDYAAAETYLAEAMRLSRNPTKAALKLQEAQNLRATTRPAASTAAPPAATAPSRK